MDPSCYIQVTTERGLNYSVYREKASDNTKPTILFAHGFPCSSYDWRHQVAYFQARGYGLLVPDMLGYGGTDKPTDVQLYVPSLMAKDMVDIVDAEKEHRVVAIGHDWGSKIVSRLANLYPERFLGFGVLAIGYYPPNPRPFSEFFDYTTKLAGHEIFGYWPFFSEEDADQVIHDNYDLFMGSCVGLPKGEARTKFGKTGALKAWISSGAPIPELPPYLTKEEHETQKKILRKDGITAPLLWYRAATSGVDMEDSKLIPLEKYTISKPLFYGKALHDVVAIPELGEEAVKKFCTNATIKDYDAGHWLIWQTPAREVLHADLEDWITKINV